ncbi:hypothetical protein QZH41_012203 [Actinostola sp. cb2023]|nr:hypothetical protein QZH41_012203 [Actinostola sp. cb2023]
MSTATLPGKFEGGDVVTWLREFDACAEANNWKAEDKIKNLPAFLRNQAQSHFYAIPADDRKTYADAAKKLKEAMCPKTGRENYFSQFEGRMLRPGEDPAVYKWELEEILMKADPDIEDNAKEVLLGRQFMRGLPKDLKIKMLQHDPTPNLENMISFVQRYRAVQEYMETNQVSATSSSSEMTQLVALVKEMATKQKQLEDTIASIEAIWNEKEDSLGKQSSVRWKDLKTLQLSMPQEDEELMKNLIQSDWECGWINDEDGLFQGKPCFDIVLALF